jgi:hypothetical protein
MPKYVDEPGLTRFYDNIADRPVQAFDTVSEMQAATYLEDGMTCHTNGFHASGDGGAAYYTVSESGTANGMDVLALQGGLFASLVTSDRVSPEQLGAYGNGASDDTASFARSFAIASVISLSGGKTYVITDKITSTSDLRVCGNGATILNKSGNASATVDYIFSFDNDETQIDSVNFDSNNQSRGSVKFTGGMLRVTNCSFTGYSAAYGHYQTDSQVWADHFEHVVFDNCYFHDNGYSYSTTTETLNRCITADGGTGTAMVTNCIFERVNQAIVDACAETVITGCAFAEHSDNAIYDASDTTLISNTIFNATSDESIITQGITEVSNCRFLNVANRCIGINGAMGLLTVRGCSFVATSVSVMGIVVTRADTNLITHCVFADNVVLLNNATLNNCLNFGEVQYFHFTGNHISGSAASQGSSSMVRVINAIEYIIMHNIIHQNTTGINLFVSVTPLNASTSIGIVNDNISDDRIRYYPLSTSALHSSKLYRQSGVSSHFQGAKVPSIITTNMSAPPTDETYPVGTIMVLTSTGVMYVYTSANTWVQV